MFTDEVEGDGDGVPDSAFPRPSLASDRRDYMSLAAVPRLSRPSVELKVPLPPSQTPKAWNHLLPSGWAALVLLWWWLRGYEKTLHLIMLYL